MILEARRSGCPTDHGLGQQAVALGVACTGPALDGRDAGIPDQLLVLGLTQCLHVLQCHFVLRRCTALTVNGPLRGEALRARELHGPCIAHVDQLARVGGHAALEEACIDPTAAALLHVRWRWSRPRTSLARQDDDGR